MGSLEALVDPHGSVILGWLEPGVFYARLDETLSIELATRFVARFSALIEGSVEVRYFYDASSVESYELSALDVVWRSLLAHQAQIQVIVARPWQDTVSEKALEFSLALDCLRYVTSGAEFDASLRAAAPGGSLSIPSSGGAAAEAFSLPPTQPEPSPYIYIFDLKHFELGLLTATRRWHLYSRPEQSWICVARDHEQALRLARQAAVSEWAPPETRGRESFTVQFIDIGTADADLAPAGREPGAWLEQEDGLGMAPAANVTYTYVFDLRDFEAGRFDVKRSIDCGMPFDGSWICKARSDAQALALARHAAMAEWPEPHTRLPEQFTVRFVSPAIESVVVRRR